MTVSDKGKADLRVLGNSCVFACIGTESGRGLQVLGRAAQARSRQQGPSLQLVRLDELPAAAAKSPDLGRMGGAGTLRWVWQAARRRIRKATGWVGMRSRAVLRRGSAATAQGERARPAP
jgi:hypothetical protein